MGCSPHMSGQLDSPTISRAAMPFAQVPHLRLTQPVNSGGLFAQEVFLGSKVDSLANCFHKRSSSLLMRGGTAMETPT